MAKNTKLSAALVNAQAAVVSAALGDGYLRIYSGGQPAGANTAITGQVLLVTLRFQNPSAPASVNGLLTFYDLVIGYPVATGTAAWFRALAADGTTPVFDGSVGVAGDTPNLVVPSTSIVIGTGVVASGLTHNVAQHIPGY